MFEFFDTITNWLFHGVYTLLADFAAYLLIKATVALIQFKIMMATFAWSVGQSVLAQLNVTAAVEAAWGQLDSDTYNALAFFRIPDALNMVMASYPAKMFLRMVGL